jgi:hypothetical protein
MARRGFPTARFASIFSAPLTGMGYVPRCPVRLMHISPYVPRDLVGPRNISYVHWF